MTTYLLDANVLIALTVAEHEHHDLASRWAAQIDGFALCPVVEGALLRFLVRIGESVGAAAEVLRVMATHPRCHRWREAISYLEADLSHVRGHRQLTDAYLASLAAANGGLLATLDAALAAALPAHTLLLPG